MVPRVGSRRCSPVSPIPGRRNTRQGPQARYCRWKRRGRFARPRTSRPRPDCGRTSRAGSAVTASRALWMPCSLPRDGLRRSPPQAPMAAWISLPGAAHSGLDQPRLCAQVKSQAVRRMSRSTGRCRGRCKASRPSRACSSHGAASTRWSLTEAKQGYFAVPALGEPRSGRGDLPELRTPPCGDSGRATAQARMDARWTRSPRRDRRPQAISRIQGVGPAVVG